MHTFRALVSNRSATDARTRHHHLYFLAGPTLTRANVEHMCSTMLADPVTETAAINPPPSGFPYAEITQLPGVTNSVAESLLRSPNDSCVDSLREAASGAHVTFAAGTGASSVAREVTGNLANVVIQRYAINQPIEAPFVLALIAEAAPVEIISLTGLDATAREALSLQRRMALDLAEMQAIQQYYLSEKREPTDIELERMVLAVAPEHWPAVAAICAVQDIEAFSLGRFEATFRAFTCSFYPVGFIKAMTLAQPCCGLSPCART